MKDPRRGIKRRRRRRRRTRLAHTTYIRRRRAGHMQTHTRHGVYKYESARGYGARAIAVDGRPPLRLQRRLLRLPLRSRPCAQSPSK